MDNNSCTASCRKKRLRWSSSLLDGSPAGNAQEGLSGEEDNSWRNGGGTDDAVSDLLVEMKGDVDVWKQFERRLSGFQELPASASTEGSSGEPVLYDKRGREVPRRVIRIIRAQLKSTQQNIEKLKTIFNRREHDETPGNLQRESGTDASGHPSHEPVNYGRSSAPQPVNEAGKDCVTSTTQNPQLSRVRVTKPVEDKGCAHSAKRVRYTFPLNASSTSSTDTLSHSSVSSSVSSSSASPLASAAEGRKKSELSTRFSRMLSVMSGWIRGNGKGGQNNQASTSSHDSQTDEDDITSEDRTSDEHSVDEESSLETQEEGTSSDVETVGSSESGGYPTRTEAASDPECPMTQSVYAESTTSEASSVVVDPDGTTPTRSSDRSCDSVTSYVSRLEVGTPPLSTADPSVADGSAHQHCAVFLNDLVHLMHSSHDGHSTRSPGTAASDVAYDSDLTTRHSDAQDSSLELKPPVACELHNAGEGHSEAPSPDVALRDACSDRSSATQTKLAEMAHWDPPYYVAGARNRKVPIFGLQLDAAECCRSPSSPSSQKKAGPSRGSTEEAEGRRSVPKGSTCQVMVVIDDVDEDHPNRAAISP